MAAPGHPTGAAIVVAAGSGQRLGAAVPKAFVDVAGRTLLEHALARFAVHPGVAQLIVVVPAAQQDAARTIAGAGTVVVAGGATRRQSVSCGLAAVSPQHQFVLVHDVARPFVPAAVIDAVLGALAAGADAVVPVLPLHDTIRRVDGGALADVVDRTTLVAVQTPQGFRRDVLVAAHAAGADHLEVTDDAGLVEAAGGRVVGVPGADESFKITTPADLARAQAIGLGSAPTPPRTRGQR